jgi:hypothetical protein
MQILNRKSGETFEVNKQRARVRRCQKRVHSWANTLQNPVQKMGKTRQVMITLTYEKVDTWEPNQIKDFMKLCRFCMGADLLAYAWVAELQERGAVHYHVILIVKKGTFIPKPDEYGWWDLGSTKIETARSLFYIVTYTGKEYQKMGAFPKGMRMFAVWLSKSLVTKVELFLHKMSALPGWLADQIENQVEYCEERIKRHVGGGWIFRGEIYSSPYVCLTYF